MPAVKKPRVNPLKADPTQTTTLRRRFINDLLVKFSLLQKKITDLVATQDVFGLKKGTPSLIKGGVSTPMTFNTKWKFNTTSEQTEKFLAWLKVQIEADILKTGLVQAEEKYWNKYIQEGYTKGAGKSYDDVMKKIGPTDGAAKQAFYAGSKAEFLRSSFANPVGIERVKQLSGRVFTDLKGVTDAMATQMSRTLLDGLTQGQSPLDVARTLNKTVDNIGKVRAATIARTETIRAHAEGQLDTLERLGVDKIGVQVEWSTTGDTLVCPLCAPLEGVVLKTIEARGLIPRHPNCRCAYIPAAVGEDPKGQKFGPVQIQKARIESLRAEAGKKGKTMTVEELKAQSRWAGADTKIAGKRPDSILKGPLKDATAATITPAPKVAPTPVTVEIPTPQGRYLISDKAIEASTWTPGKFAEGVENVLIEMDSENYIPSGAHGKIAALLLKDTVEGAKTYYTKVKGDFTFMTKVGKNYYNFDTPPSVPKEFNISSTTSIIPEEKLAGIFPGKVIQANISSEYKDQVWAELDLGKEKLKPLFEKLQKEAQNPSKATLKDKTTALLEKKAAKEAAKATKLAEKAAAKEAKLQAIAQKKADKLLEKETKKTAALQKKLEAQQAKTAAKEAHLAEKKASTVGAEAVKQEASGSLPSVADLDKIKSLPGSTHPDLMENRYTGKQWVMKSTQAGLSPDHLRSEALADDLYRVLGFDVPKSGIVETAEGPVKLAEYLDNGETLQAWLVKATKAEAEAMFKKLQEGFVADALLANYDVAGLSMDNILVVGGKAYRIDNGGSLLYRAQGKLKANFGAVVNELDTLRDSSINPNTARIFGDITDDKIASQIDQIVANKAALLDRVTDPSLRKILSDRIDYLEKKGASLVPKPVKASGKSVAASPKLGTAKERAKARVAEPGVVEGTAERVAASRINGVAIKGDRGQIEDNDILAWGEVIDEKEVTRLRLKVTPEGSEIIEKKFAAEIRSAQTISSYSPSGPSPHPDDAYWAHIEAAAKTVAHHASDGAYNLAKLENLDNEVITKLKDQISSKIFKILEKDDPKYAQMVEKYLKYAEEIKEAKEKGIAPPVVKQFKIQPPTPDPSKATTQGVRVSRVEAKRGVGSFNNGYVAKDTTVVNKLNGLEELHIDLGDGKPSVQFVPGTTDVTNQTGLAAKGTVDITIDGKVSTKTLQEAMDRLKAVGIDTTPPSKAYEELMYLHRTVYQNNDHNLKEYTNLFKNTLLTDEEKVEQIKQWASKHYKVNFEDLAKKGIYNPEGKTSTGYGDGYRHWQRWDITPEALAKKLQGFTLQHNTSINLPDFVERVLQSGGQCTSTVERIRKGVSLSSTGGMSSSADINSGGASYFFTRVAWPNASLGNLRFKIDNLLRQDSISYRGDKYGSIAELAERKAKLAEYAALQGKSSNETIFKHGLSLLDDLEEIVTYSPTERQAIIDAFHRNKVTHLTDGRSIEDVVKLKVY